MRTPHLKKCAAGLTVLFSLAASVFPARAEEKRILDLPDYSWYAGCFGTACGNLAGFWDRNGFPLFYTGPTGGGIAPLTDGGANSGIHSLWASRAGQDGRPASQPGHVDDYWTEFDASYQSTANDPYLTAGRPEHPADCIGDFIGLSQKKWVNQNGECDGNVDAFSFVYWDATGARRHNFTPGPAAGLPARDIQSGLREWAAWRGYEANVFTQLSDFNPATPSGRGFTYEDLKREINSGYPVLIFLQDFREKSRALPGMPKANPEIHAMLAYGFLENPIFNLRWVFCKTSWGVGEAYYDWSASPWVYNSAAAAQLSVRGVIGFHPLPKIRSIRKQNANLLLEWDGPAARVQDNESGDIAQVHQFQVEKTPSLSSPVWTPVAAPATQRSLSFPAPVVSEFYRVRLLE